MHCGRWASTGSQARPLAAFSVASCCLAVGRQLIKTSRRLLCGGGTGVAMRLRGASLTRIRVGGVPEHFNAPWHTAAAQGLFEEAGLLVEWTDFPGGTGAMMSALRAGEVDVALALTEGIVSDLHRERHAGGPLLFGTYVSTPLVWGVHVRADSAVVGVEQLAGCRYAVSRMGSGSHLMACVDATQRGLDPEALEYEVVGSIDGAVDALGEGRAHAFMWEKFTTKHLVDRGVWRRVHEVPTPWPCFSIAASAQAAAEGGDDLLRMLEVVRGEAARLRASEDVHRTIGVMFGQKDEDVAEWLRGVRWSCRAASCHTMLRGVMAALVEARVLRRDELLEPAALCSSRTADADPDR